jgi:DNA-binding transcriptional MerR regulator
MTFMTIGEFGERTRLSPKALRLYEQLGLVIPAEVDPGSGYRRYAEDQVETARLVGLLRRLDMPLALIGEILELAPAKAAQAVAAYGKEQEAAMHERRALASYLRARLMGESPRMYDIEVRTMPTPIRSCGPTRPMMRPTSTSRSRRCPGPRCFRPTTPWPLG